MTTFYVTATDSFMSGWGNADGKTNRLTLVCEGRQEAHIVKDNMERRGDMKRITLSTTMPKYSKKTHLHQVKTKADYPKWYQERAF